MRDYRDLKQALLDHLVYDRVKDMYSATPRDKYNAVVQSVIEQLAEKWIGTQQMYYHADAKRVYYLSLEFLLGRLLRNYALNLGLSSEYAEAVDVLGMTYEQVVELEWDAGLGNGGLGRLAACFLDSLATLEYPAYGYGIRYEFGSFTQKIKDGCQVESPENWLRYGNPWEFPRPELLYNVRFCGRVNTISGGNGRFRMEWEDGEDVMAMAYDYPVPGFRNNTVNTLRLWAAKSTRDFNLDFFNSGDYFKAVADKSHSETISKVLYPDDQSLAGKELRLRQQYFFVCATIRDIIRRYRKFHRSYREFPEKTAIQLNDTHPSIAIAELMRILVDEEGIGWDDAWGIVSANFGYTNHTVLPEALETWSVGLFSYLLPRHLQIIREIDRRFLVAVAEKFPGDQERAGRMSIISEEAEGTVHMARLAVVGSHTVNGVSELHSEILRKNLFNDFYLMTPDKFMNVTNGVTPRRWLLHANPGLAGLITEAIGEKWMTDLDELGRLEPLAEDAEFRRRFRAVKLANKGELSVFLNKTSGLSLNPQLLLDCQVKRFHEYKRQLLNTLHVISLYNMIREGRAGSDFVPRTVLFAGKAAHGYYICKLIIKLIHNVAAAIDAVPELREKIKVIFVPNYSVTLAQRIIPAAELSEQISTAGYEASGTGNMKFTLNGALTIGTLDGANVEIREEVGEENFFLFGLRADDIMNMGDYDPRRYYETDLDLKKAIDQIAGGYFSHDNTSLFHPLTDGLLRGDRFFVMADYASYAACQERVSRAYNDAESWTRMAVLNVARSGKFSSDRSISEYTGKIWKVSPVGNNQ